MQVSVLVEPIGESGFRAQSGAPLHLSAEGGTVEAATQHLAQLIQARLNSGAQLLALNIANGSGPVAPPLPADDLYQTDWVYRELQEAIAENRRQEEANNG